MADFIMRGSTSTVTFDNQIVILILFKATVLLAVMVL